MKIRNGFVSNSSSSSFILFGIRQNIEDVTYDMLKKYDFTVLGEYFEEGKDVFNIGTEDKDMLDFIKTCNHIYKDKSPFQLYRNFGGEGTIDLSTLPKKGEAELIGGEAAQGSCWDLNELYENYCGQYSETMFDADKIKAEMIKITRKEKIIKIEDED